MLSVVKVDNKSALKVFIDFPHALYANDPCYVPELYMSQKHLLAKDGYPFHKHSDVELFLLFDDTRLVGRIAAIHNKRHNAFYNTTDGFFGFFECEENPLYAAALLNAVKQWLKQRSLTTLIGPVNFSTNETCGLLIEGFNEPPVVNMTYGKKYYQKYFEEYGLLKDKDLVAYNINLAVDDPRIFHLGEKLRQRLEKKDIIIRPIDMKNYNRDIKGILSVYNSAWDKNYGFAPMTSEEFFDQAKELKGVIEPSLFLVAEHKGVIVAFSLALPDLNQALIHIKRGRLFPFGLLQFLYHKRSINQMRVIAEGIIPASRKLGIESAFHNLLFENAIKKGYQRAEASWVLEDNLLMSRGIADRMRGQIYKKYRLYKQAL